jgi:hypothetical protein
MDYTNKKGKNWKKKISFGRKGKCTPTTTASS